MTSHKPTLDEILDELQSEGATDDLTHDWDADLAQAKAQIEQAVREIIGNNENPETYFSNNRQWEVPEPEEAKIRNKLKDDQLKRLDNWIGKGEE